MEEDGDHLEKTNKTLVKRLLLSLEVIYLQVTCEVDTFNCK